MIPRSIRQNYLRHCFGVDISGSTASLQCYWKVNDKHEESTPCRTLDLILIPVSVARQPQSSNSPANHALWADLESTQSKAFQFLREAIKDSVSQYGSSITALKLVLPTVDGYAVRNDMIQRRFLTCHLAEKVADFTTLRRQIHAFDFRAESLLQRALRNAVGAVLLKRLPGFDVALVESAMASVEADVAARLSLPWIMPNPLPRKRLAMVEGRPNPAVSTASLGIYRAAQALGVELVVLDREGHWLQDDAMGHMRDEFIACDLTQDEGLADRIFEALSKSKAPIDAVTTYLDDYLIPTARAATRLGLHTNPPEALVVCRDKQKTREMASPDVRILSVTGVGDLKEQMACLASPLRYPQIVKPAVGIASEGVSKVMTEEALLATVKRNEEKFPGVKILVEPYATGPEVDANFILLDGKLLWSEVNDDFPSTADSSQHTGPSASPSFAEISTIMPSILPAPELSLLQSSLTSTLLAMGFKTGVFHLEARLQHSSKAYGPVDTGIELVDASPQPAAPSVFLIEINARIPGHQESFAVEYTYGIDYFAVHMLAAMSGGSDGGAVKTAICALSQPLPDQVRFPTNIVFVPAERGGRFGGARPLPGGLMGYVAQHAVFMQEGEVVRDPRTEGRWPFVAYFLIVGTMCGMEGREQVRTLGDIVRQSFEYEMQ